MRDFSFVATLLKFTTSVNDLPGQSPQLGDISSFMSPNQVFSANDN